MTRYYVDVSPELARLIPYGKIGERAGFRFIARAGDGVRDSERWLAEDDGAPADLQGYLIEPAFSSVNGQAVITDRRILSENGLHDATA